ncbi:transmembrane channel-like protein 7 isoform X2 [Bombus vancouverensis nearcticus]|uniref:transmembrane channel-like protein 7 isoform X2 n=1 Tax=Bombus vancouverensis nearcticus TaxID=2705178 RepID=UPI00402B9EC6
MSGGERKKRACDKGQGWEEAGAEFYQESYPAAIEADLQQALQRDPSHIATLLPSKKSRVATAKRIRNDTKTTLRRRTSTRSRGTTTSRRMSTNIHDAAVSMLPDLSENLSNEERTWEEIMQIKAMPVCMAQKIQLKNQLQSATKLRLQGFEQLKWQRRKAWQQFRIRMKEAYSKMELWNDSLKTIGGNFGMGVVAYFLFIKCLIAIVKSAAKSFKQRVVENEGQFYQYCNLVFGGWDYCIHNEKSAAVKHKALYNEMKAFLEAERLEEERQNRTREETTKLFLMRFFINLIVLVVLCGSGVLIYHIFEFSLDQVSPQVNETYDLQSLPLNKIAYLFFEFLPYICIVVLNLAVPFLFRYLVSLENYSPSFVIRITLLRTVFLRLSSFIVLLTSFYRLIVTEVTDNKCTADRRPLCWETFVGQQFFKLYITDLFLQFFMTFFVNFPRSLIAKHTENKVLRFFGEQEFDLPKHVLDVVYLQTICWLGFFYAPLLPLIAIFGTFVLFYIKKFACLVNSTPSSKVYRASKSNAFFMLILLISFILSTVPIGYSIAEIVPSKSCGPFRGFESVWSLLIVMFAEFPYWLQSILYFLGTAGFGVPAFVILTLLLYYYYAVSIANKHMVTVLKNQLVLEGHDKQFLLNRLSAFIKQQQDQNKYHQEQTNELGTFS